MSASVPARQLSAADAGTALTQDRDELKYFIEPAAVPGLARALSRKLGVHRYTGPGANRLPHPQHFTTTVYFDTPSQALRRAAVADPADNAKLRAREYYDLHPGLAEVAVDPAQIVRYQPTMWFELKRKHGARTLKARVELPKREVPAFFRGEHPAWHTTGEAALLDAQQIAGYCRELAEPLGASCLVHYRRLAFQDDAAALRVTLDLDLAFYAPPADLWTRQRALVRDTLGRALGQPKKTVVEVKAEGPAPAWLKAALADAGARSTGYSKFLAATDAVHGPL